MALESPRDRLVSKIGPHYESARGSFNALPSLCHGMGCQDELDDRRLSTKLGHFEHHVASRDVFKEQPLVPSPYVPSSALQTPLFHLSSTIL